MYKLREKLNRQEGFTLVEMLIVVAIIAILVAVSIPLVGSALESARKATDDANVRAAKAETMLYFMGATDDTLTIGGVNYAPGSAITADNNVYYDAEEGKLTTAKPTDGYGKSAETDTAADPNAAPADKVIKVIITDKGVFSYTWE